MGRCGLRARRASCAAIYRRDTLRFPDRPPGPLLWTKSIDEAHRGGRGQRWRDTPTAISPNAIANLPSAPAHSLMLGSTSTPRPVGHRPPRAWGVVAAPLRF